MTGHHSLRTRGLVSGYGRSIVVDGVDVEIPAGRVSVIVGANACGKSTLLKTLSRLVPVQSGTVVLDDRPIGEVPTKELARTLGLLPQQPVAPEGIAVADLVGRGRHPHQRLFRSWTADDDRAVTEALRATGVIDLADRPVDELSGGQRQRVVIARALAAEPRLVIADEPIASLDVSIRAEILEVLQSLVKDHGVGMLYITHDLLSAKTLANHALVLRDGELIESGPADEVIDNPRAEYTRQLRDAIPNPFEKRTAA